MSATIERAGIRERLAIAAATSDLSPENRAADMLGAHGAAVMSMHVDPADGLRKADLTPVGTAIQHPARRLAGLLQLAKFANDRGAALDAVHLFAWHLGRKRTWCNRFRVKSGSELLRTFAGIVITEWLHDRCAQCGGGGRIRLGNVAAKNTQTDVCGVCKGSGAAKTDHASRATALNIRMEAYTAHWSERFDEARRWLMDLEDSNIGALQSQMRRGTLRAVSE